MKMEFVEESLHKKDRPPPLVIDPPLYPIVSLASCVLKRVFRSDVMLFLNNIAYLFYLDFGIRRKLKKCRFGAVAYRSFYK